MQVIWRARRPGLGGSALASLAAVLAGFAAHARPPAPRRNEPPAWLCTRDGASMACFFTAAECEAARARARERRGRSTACVPREVAHCVGYLEAREPLQRCRDTREACEAERASLLREGEPAGRFEGVTACYENHGRHGGGVH